MTRFEYIKEVEKLLKNKVADQELYDIMRDYAEFFDEGKKQGKTEDEVIKSLGDPHKVAEDILGDEKPSSNDTLSSISEKVVNGTKKATKTVMNVAETTANNISDATNKATQKVKEKREKKEKTTKPDKAPKVPKSSKSPEKTSFKPVLGTMLAFLIYPILAVIFLTGVSIIVGTIAFYIVFSLFSFIASSKLIVFAFLIMMSLIFFGIGVILLSIVLLREYNASFFKKIKNITQGSSKENEQGPTPEEANTAYAQPENEEKSTDISSEEIHKNAEEQTEPPSLPQAEIIDVEFIKVEKGDNNNA